MASLETTDSSQESSASSSLALSVSEKIYQSEIAMIRMISELEVKFDKLKQAVAKIKACARGAATTNSGQY